MLIKKLNNRKFILFTTFIILTTIILSGCTDELFNADPGTASIKGKFGFVDDNGETNYDSQSLIVLKKENDEVKRKYIDYEDNGSTNFEFTNLNKGEYTLEFYNFNLKNKSVDVTLQEDEDYLLDDIILEGEDKERARNDFLFLNPEIDILSNKNFRLALAHAIDQKNLATNLENNIDDIDSAQEANRLLSPSRYGYDDSILKLEYNIETAINYLNNSNYDLPINTDIVYNSGNEHRKINIEGIANQINNLDDFQINLNAKGISFNEGYLDFNSISVLGVTGYGPIGILELLADFAKLNFEEYKVNDKTLDDIFYEAYLNQDNLEKVMELVTPVEKMLIEEGYYIPLVYYYIK